MHHTITSVAKTQRLDVEKLVEFAKTNRNAFVDMSGELITTTFFVDGLIDDFLAAGNERLAWVRDPKGGLIQPGLLK